MWSLFHDPCQELGGFSQKTLYLESPPLLLRSLLLGNHPATVKEFLCFLFPSQRKGWPGQWKWTREQRTSSGWELSSSSESERWFGISSELTDNNPIYGSNTDSGSALLGLFFAHVCTLSDFAGHVMFLSHVKVHHHEKNQAFVKHKGNSFWIVIGQKRLTDVQ